MVRQTTTTTRDGAASEISMNPLRSALISTLSPWLDRDEDIRHLHLGTLAGEVDLLDVQLKQGKILAPGVRLLRGSVGRLSLRVPWTRLLFTQDPVTFTLHDVEIFVEPFIVDDLDSSNFQTLSEWRTERAKTVAKALVNYNAQYKRRQR